MFKVLGNQKGGATTMWLMLLPAFLMIGLFFGSMFMVKMSHSSAEVAADAGSIAATKKLDEWILPKLPLPTQGPVTIPGSTDRLGNEKIQEMLSKVDQQLLANIADQILKQKEQEMVEAVRYYVQKNGGDVHGKIIYPVEGGRIEVQARVRYRPLIFQDFFQDTYIQGSGMGPKREFLKLLPKRVINF